MQISVLGLSPALPSLPPDAFDVGEVSEHARYVLDCSPEAVGETVGTGETL